MIPGYPSPRHILRKVFADNGLGLDLALRLFCKILITKGLIPLVCAKSS